MIEDHGLRNAGNLGEIAPGIRGEEENAASRAVEAFKLFLEDAFSVDDGEYEFVSAADIRRRALTGAER